ncbi:hypothetical protein COV20_05510 [Candidatus Woesearchaeota archaeon CG10_big_fil_rev_8_21_14_0_10_45_16]|nr:MAG: hypothetical protein COV20_05510 [Candidatus Woesearchaeota archaeon CG10_big_fil_rev_8_21_14_0_10_45_16]
MEQKTTTFLNGSGLKQKMDDIQPGLVEETPQDHSKEDSKKLIWTLVVIIGLFVLTFAAFKLYNAYAAPVPMTLEELHQANLEGKLPEEQGYLYNGYSFVNIDGLWWTEVTRANRAVKFPLHFSPRDLEDIPVSGSLEAEFYKSDDLYIATDPMVFDKYYTLAVGELSMNVAQGIGIRPIGSCTEENGICDNRTIVSCENTQGLPVVEFVLGEEARIDLNGTCIKITGQGYDITKAADRVLYQWYQIMI